MSTRLRFRHFPPRKSIRHCAPPTRLQSGVEASEMMEWRSSCQLGLRPECRVRTFHLLTKMRLTCEAGTVQDVCSHPIDHPTSVRAGFCDIGRASRAPSPNAWCHFKLPNPQIKSWGWLRGLGTRCQTLYRVPWSFTPALLLTRGCREGKMSEAVASLGIG